MTSTPPGQRPPPPADGPEPGPMRVVIADDQRVIRDGLVTIVGAIPGAEVVGAACDGAEAIALA